MLAAAMNPCPCGFHNDRTHECHCTPPMIQRYISKISGPLLDRIDIHIDVPAVNYKEMRSAHEPDGSAHQQKASVHAPAATCAVPCQQQRYDLLQRSDGAAAHANVL
jgi:magnesium chelatase family protein